MFLVKAVAPNRIRVRNKQLNGTGEHTALIICTSSYLCGLSISNLSKAAPFCVQYNKAILELRNITKIHMQHCIPLCIMKTWVPCHKGDFLHHIIGFVWGILLVTHLIVGMAPTECQYCGNGSILQASLLELLCCQEWKQNEISYIFKIYLPSHIPISLFSFILIWAFYYLTY